MQRRLLAWLTGGLAVAYVVLRRARRRPPEPPGPDPAAELRRKLEESRSVAEREAPAAQTEAAEADDLEQRRRQVHERGRAAVEEMRRDAPAEPPTA